MARRPNILVFFSDQQRWDTCGCYGQPLDITPNLDRMASEGVRFDLAFTPQPVCGPARAAIQTGKYPTEIGCHTNHRRLPGDETTIAHRLRAAGYEAGYIGKWHLASFGPDGSPDNFRVRPVPPDRRGGYDDFWLASDVLEYTSYGYGGHMFDGDGAQRDFPEGRFRADAQTDWVLEYLRERRDAGRDGNRPFFLFASYIEPHHQNNRGHYEGPTGSRQRFAEFATPGDLADADGDWREEYPDYLGCCAALDANLGRIGDELDRLGLADNTLLAYTSDHGSHFRTRNGEYKRSCHDASLRVPMVFRGSGFSGGTVSDALVSLIDLPPTLLTAGGVDVPETMRGRALQPLADGPAPDDWPDDVFAQISESHCGRTVRTKRWKYAVRAPDKSGGEPDSEVYVEDFLYDLEADPHERDNRVADPSLAEVRSELAQRLTRRMTAVGEAAPTIRPATGEA
ncbi:MAG: sulfatase-like hydrolase/transferase [Phycisphaerae bacterium]|nr:sulfatase-like hydrolase/transferase [Phycisphaerae bacterium]